MPHSYQGLYYPFIHFKDDRVASPLFDSLYLLMLRMLGYTFTPGGTAALQHAFGHQGAILMATVLEPLGETLAVLPASDDPMGATAGLPFGLTRHVVLPADTNAARILVAERLSELVAIESDLAAAPAAPAALSHVVVTLRRLSGVMVAGMGASASRATGI